MKLNEHCLLQLIEIALFLTKKKLVLHSRDLYFLEIQFALIYGEGEEQASKRLAVEVALFYHESYRSVQGVTPHPKSDRMKKWGDSWGAPNPKV